VSAENLCLRCGMCCDGTIFSNVPVSADELAALEKRRRLPMIESAMRFAQPCAAHRDGRCEVYDVRPQPCADFRCLVLERHLRGEIDEDAAHAMLAEIKTLAASVRAGLPDGERIALRNFLDESLVMDEAWRRANGALLVDAKILAMLIGRELVRR
jgi:Fe-S-cluster containining protein